MMRNNLFTLRETLGYKRSVVAEALKVDVSTYYRWEMRGYPFSLTHLLAMAKFFEVAPVEICPWLAERPKETQPDFATTGDGASVWP